MDPLYEQRLRDEVVYLHSLWYQGPPRPAAAVATRYSLQPSQSIHFKKVQKRRGQSGNVFSSNAALDSSSSHEAVWPCPPTPPSPAAWPPSSGPTPEPLSLSAEEQLKLEAKDAHHHAVKAVRDFLISNNADGFDEIDSSDDDDDDRQMDEDCGHEEYSFFCKMFEDTKLREYYENNFVVGEFSCLVCGAVGGKKTAKRFNGCLPLVQHSINIEKTKRRAAHRAFAQAVCKVLGWDIHQLPKIVSMLSDKSGNAQGNGNGKNKESSVAFVHNVDSVKDDAAASASDAGKELEDVDILRTPCNLEEPGSHGLTTSFIACPVDKTENQVRPRNIVTIAPTTASVPIPPHHLQPSEVTKFKKKKKRKGKSGKILAKKAVTESNSPHDTEWPCPSPPYLPSTSGWPTTGWVTLEKSSPKPVLLSNEEQSILAARHAHKNALKLFHEFFRTNNSDDSDEIDSSSDDDDDELMEEDSGSEEYNFFLKVFEEVTMLRECYVKNFSEGEFSCLVCGAVGWKKSGKKFKGCLPLLQHLITITKTKKRKAHRALGRAVCNVLGWDIEHLPTIDSMLSDKTSETQGNSNSSSKEGSVSCVGSVDLVKDVLFQLCKMSFLYRILWFVLMLITLTCADSNKNLENSGMVHQQSMEEPASQGLTTNSLVGHDADDNENLGIVLLEEQSASERSEINSLVGPDADNNETLGILQPMEQPTSEGSKINSSVGPYVDNQESLGVVRQVEQPASERSKINSLVGPDADNNENLGILHQMEQPASEGSTINSSCSDADRNSGNDNLHAHNLEDKKTE